MAKEHPSDILFRAVTATAEMAVMATGHVLQKAVGDLEIDKELAGALMLRIGTAICDTVELAFCGPPDEPTAELVKV